MLLFPINTQTFQKAFLGENGTIEIHSTGDIWNDLLRNRLRFEKAALDFAELNDSLG